MLQHVEVMVLSVFAIYPSHPTVHLFGVGVNAITGHTRDRPAVLILYTGFYLCLFAEAQFRERLFRLSTEGLPSFGCVDLGESDFHLLLALVQDG
jgi:hypothetical protein